MGRHRVAKGELNMMFVRKAFVLGPALMLAGTAAFAQPLPKDILPRAVTQTAPASVTPAMPESVSVQPEEVPSAQILIFAPAWPLADAGKLLGVVRAVAKRGLMAADYEPEALQAAITAGEGVALNDVATRIFTRLATDLRDGRTPLAARVQWLIVDSDAVTLPIDVALTKTLASHDIDGALTALEPKHPDYAALKAELAKTPAADTVKIGLLRVNLERWRWMPQSLGEKHVLANVPEYMVRVNTYGRNIAAYRVIVGKKDTATPQLSAKAVGIVVHPPWLLPQSIIRQEVGPLIARDPAAARARGYVWTGSGKTLSVVQKPGPTAALGQLKIDMPNSEAIFLHDTPNKTLFANNPRAYSHGCLRTERAFELGILLSLIQSGDRLDDVTVREHIADDLVTLIRAGKTEKYPFKEPIPVHIGYFTMATAGGKALHSFPDLYGRDGPVLAAFARPRVEQPTAAPATAPPAAPIPAPVG
jgi:murein L,D-transpeptidase YcbB/YkuD